MANLRNFKVVVGRKQLRKSLEKGIVKWVFLAKNADPVITELLAGMCRDKDVGYTWVGTMAALGSACGIEVGAAAAAVVK